MTARPVTETDGGWYPFWSPDGQSLGFFADGKLKAIDLRGGSPRTLAEAPSGRGGSWSRNGTILFAPNIASPILRVSSQGGKTEPVTTYDSKTEVTHRYPVFLPDGRHFLYMSRARSEGRNVGRLMLSSLDGGGSSVLVEDASNGLYVEPGYLNLRALREPVRAALRPEIPESHRRTGSHRHRQDELLGAEELRPVRRFRRRDPRLSAQCRPPHGDALVRSSGAPPREPGPLRLLHHAPDLPDGRKVAYIQGDSPQSPNDIWIRDLEFNRTYRLTQQSGLYALPTWAPDSDRIAFVCQPKGQQDFCATSLSSGGETHLLYSSQTWKTLGSWTPDGKALFFASQDPQTNEDILQLSADAKGEPSRIFSTPFVEDEPQVSPDSHRMAFVSDQTGRPEVYVRNLGGTPGQWQISADGGWQPRWRSDGKELIYVGADGYVMAVPLQGDGTFRPGAPFRLFLLPEPSELDAPILEDATRDDSRFLLSVPTTGRSSISFHAITDWPALLPREGG
jgi:Tol biopolymer transport system component